MELPPLTSVSATPSTRFKSGSTVESAISFSSSRLLFPVSVRLITSLEDEEESIRITVGVSAQDGRERLTRLIADDTLSSASSRSVPYSNSIIIMAFPLDILDVISDRPSIVYS